jgi:hypothetical protein
MTETVPGVEAVQEGRYVKEKFQMRLKGEAQIYPVVINHTLAAVKIGNTVFKRAEFNNLIRAGSAQARSVLLGAEILDGEVLGKDSSEEYSRPH